MTRRLETLVQRRPLPEGSDLERVGAITVRLHRPPFAGDEPCAAVLWIHGGGYIAGDPAQDDRLCQSLARRLGVLVAAVGYRRAPEHPFPDPLHDCYDALVWLSERDDVDATRIAIGGGSAGGGLAAALALLARDRGEVRPAFQLLSYPMLDDRTTRRTDVDERHFRIWNNKTNRFGWQSYLGCPPGSAGVDPLAAPARHEDLSGLPPAWIGVGTLDLFHDENLTYAGRLLRADVRCQVHVVEGAFHGFDRIRPKAAPSQEYLGAQVRALAGGLGIDI